MDRDREYTSMSRTGPQNDVLWLNASRTSHHPRPLIDKDSQTVKAHCVLKPTKLSGTSQIHGTAVLLRETM